MRRVSDIQTLILAGTQIAGMDANACRNLIAVMTNFVALGWRDVFNEHANSRLVDKGAPTNPDRWATSFEGYLQLLQ